MSDYSLTPQAAQDLEEIHDFIAADQPAAALRLVNLLEEECRMIAQSPKMGREREELALGVRSFPVGHYIIFYRPVQSGIQVIRVLHGARDIEAFFEDET